MRKEDLRQLKRINATSTMVRLAKENKQDIVYKTRWGNYQKKAVYDLMVRCQTRELNGSRILMVCIFFPGNVARGELAPFYEIYCNPNGDEYITRVLDKNGIEQGWSGAMADNLDEMYYHLADTWYLEDKSSRIWQNPEGKSTIQSFLGTQKKGFFGLVEWQRKVKKEKTEEKERRQQEPWDRDMALIPEAFPSFYTWMEKDGHSKHYIFYEYDKKGVREGYCSHCRRQVPIENPRHNKKGRCTKCGAEITFKATSKIQTLSTGWYEAQVIQRIKGGIVIRAFSQCQYYRNTDYRSPRIATKEIERILILDTGKVKRYYYGQYKNKFYRWILDSGYIPEKHTYYCTTRLYKRNLPALKKNILKNSAIDFWEQLPTDVANYLAIEVSNPVVEKLARIGMFRLAEDFINKRSNDKLLNKEQTELAKMLRIDSARLKRLKALSGKTAHLQWYQYEKLVNGILPDEMIRDFGNAELIPDSFFFLPFPVPFVKAWNYLKKQAERGGMTMSRTLITWRDYINMAEQNKMDTKNDMICRPKDVYAAHQRMILLLQEGEMEKEAQKLERKWSKVNKVLPDLKKFEFTRDGYAIVVPDSILDIVKEGHALQHCVHTCDFYFDRIQKHESYLFFLRKAENPDIPWYTLEVEPSGNIRQKRTTGDNQGKDLEEAVKFLKAWQKDFSKKLTQEEKELGKKADQARRREYSRLRADGNKVWHGRLAGQLLADVLEQDFMAAGT